MNGKIIAILFAELFASGLPPDLGPFASYGLPGLVIAYFVWRDYRQEKHRDNRQEIEDARFDQLVQSVNGLVRVTSIEVMSRPDVSARARAETDEILSKLPTK